MAHIQLTAEERAETGSAPTGRLRRRGMVPGVVYRSGESSRPLAVVSRDLRRAVSQGARTSVVDLAVDGEDAMPVIVKAMQLDPVRGDYLHVDFQPVDLTQEVEMAVGITFVGTAVGVREGGGILDQPVRELAVRALPDSIPDTLEHDVSDLDVGSTVTVADMVAPSGVEIVADPELVVASIVLPRAAIEEEVAIEEEAVELGVEPEAEAEASEEPAESAD